MLRTIRIVLWAGIVLVAFGMTVGLGAVVQSAASGRAAQTSLPLRVEPAASETVFGRTDPAPVGRIIVDHATLDVRAGGAGYAALQAVDILVSGGLWLAILVLILRVAGRFSAGRPFELHTVRQLRLIGWSMVALNAWMWLRMLALPPVLLASLNPSAGAYRLLPTIAEGIDGVRNARVDTSFGFGLLAAGLLILILAETFRQGAALREDNEAIV